MSPTDITWLDYIVIPAVALLALGIIIRAGRGVWKFFSRINRFLFDWFGEPAREGVEGRMGVMARLQAEEDATEELRETQQTATAGLEKAVTDLTEQIEQQPQHIDEMCDNLRTTMREERQEVITAALGQHVTAFHANPQGQA